MEDEKDFPKPQTDLPEPEKEITAYSSSSSFKTRFKGTNRTWLAILILIFAILVLAIFAGKKFMDQQKLAKITDFESCVAAGNAVMESYPEQCAANGQTFTRTLTEEEQKKLDPKSGWIINSSKTDPNITVYLNTKYNYSFEMPSEWNFSFDTDVDTPDAIIFDNPELAYRYEEQLSKSYIYIDVYKTDVEDISLISEELENEWTEGSESPKPTFPKTILSGVKAIRYDVNNSGERYDIIVESIYNGNLYSIQNWLHGGNNESDSVFEEMIKSFKFTDSLDISNWKIYQRYGFSYKYPPSWNKAEGENEITSCNQLTNGPYNEVTNLTSDWVSICYYHSKTPEDLIREDNIAISEFPKINTINGVDVLEGKTYLYKKNRSTTLIPYNEGSVIIQYMFGEDEDTFNQILSTFQFTDEGSSEFICPSPKYIDCMPTIGKSKPMCAKDYLSWVSENCPNVNILH